MDEVQQFLAHYGIKGMKRPVAPTRLTRVYRVANGTASKKVNLEKAKKMSMEDTKANSMTGKDIVAKLLAKCGGTKLADLG